MRILAFSGKARSGKTTIAHRIASEHPGKAVVLSFATKLKEEVRCNFDTEWTDQKGTTCRTLLDIWGQARREIDMDYWISPIVDRINTLYLSNHDIVLIDDMRYWNEAKALNSLGAELYRIERLWGGVQNPLTPTQQQSPSETDLDLYPHFKDKRVFESSAHTDMTIWADSLRANPSGK